MQELVNTDYNRNPNKHNIFTLFSFHLYAFCISSVALVSDFYRNSAVFLLLMLDISYVMIS